MVNKPRKEAYKNFYATYDADADFERMKVMINLVLFCNESTFNFNISRLLESSSLKLSLRRKWQRLSKTDFVYFDLSNVFMRIVSM